jgi:hypothetical protein
MSAKAKGARNEHRSMRLLEAASFARPQSRGIPSVKARGVANPQRGHWITVPAIAYTPGQNRSAGLTPARRRGGA